MYLYLLLSVLVVVHFCISIAAVILEFCLANK